MASLSAFIPFIMSCSAIALTVGAAPDLPFFSNPLSVFFLMLSITSLLMVVVPRLLKWGWEASYFGVSLLCVGSAAIFGGVPWLCLLFFGAQPLLVRVGLFVVYGCCLLMWCHRFVSYYRKMYSDDRTRSLIYEIDNGVPFYMQKGDKGLAERLKFQQAPSNALFLVCMTTGVALLLFIKPVTEIIGLPFVHIFLGVAAIPIDMLALGQALRAWLIFYYYPAKMKKITGHRVYVDMGTKPSGL